MLYDELIGALKKKKLSKKQLYQLKRELCKRYNVREIPTDIQVLLHASPNDVEKIGLLTKPVRTISGVAVIAVMSWRACFCFWRCSAELYWKRACNNEGYKEQV